MAVARMCKKKESGVDWIGEMPVEWATTRLRYLCSFQTGDHDTQDADENGNYPFYVRSPIIERSNTFTFNGDGILMAGDGVGAGRIFHKVTGLYAVHQRVYRLANFSNDIDKDFLYYYISNRFPEIMDMGSAQSTVPSVRLPMLKNFAVCLPPTNEQATIVAYLDNRCSAIDRTIKATQESIEKLKEYKAALITHVITKGLNPDAEMKDSCVEWIGKIPKHWQIERLRFIGRTQNGISKDSKYFGQGSPFVSYKDVYDNAVLPLTGSGLVESSKEEQKRYSVLDGDIFFTRTSETADEVGFSSVCKQTIPHAVFAGFLIRVRPFNKKIIKDFASYYFRANHLRPYLTKEMNVTTRASLGQNLLKNMPVLIPPIEEQQKIAIYLDAKCTYIDRLISKKEQLIDKFVEYRQSLIYHAVTGKLDCRKEETHDSPDSP